MQDKNDKNVGDPDLGGWKPVQVESLDLDSIVIGRCLSALLTGSLFPLEK